MTRDGFEQMAQKLVAQYDDDDVIHDYPTIAKLLRAQHRSFVRLVKRYQKECDVTMGKLFDSHDATDVNMYWRADGGFDLCEALLDALERQKGKS